MTRELRVLLATLFAVATIATIASAQAPARTPDELLQSLTCKPGQDCEPPPPGRKRGGGGGNRSFSFQPNTEQGRVELEQKVKAGSLPSADLEVTFDFNSDIVGPEAKRVLAPLGVVLTNPKLAANRFVLVGHTDAKGNDAYNQALSERRAAAVKRHLVDAFGIAPDRLDTYGRGRKALKRPDTPLVAENRRVQVINHGVAVGAVR